MCRNKSYGVVSSTLLFIVATVGITATATLGIYKAYEEYIVKPRAPTELQRIKLQVTTLEESNQALARQNEGLLEVQRSSTQWKESESYREYLIDRAIALGDVLTDLVVRRERIRQGNASAADRVLTVANRLRPVVAVSPEALERESWEHERRKELLEKALATLSQTTEVGNLSSRGFSAAEVELLKSEVPRLRAVVAEYEARILDLRGKASAARARKSR